MNTIKHKKFLFKVLNILDNNNIEYCLWGGTLLGAVREQGFLASDIKDTDIAVDEKYYWKIRHLLDKKVSTNKMKWHYIWRKEVSVCSLDDKIKVDIFFLEKQEDKYYVYSYTPNNIDGKWNHEWRMSFNIDNFFPTKQINFLHRSVKVPNNYKTLLKELYGDWETPDPNWKCEPESYPNLDNNYNGFFPAGFSSKEYKIDKQKYKYGYIMTTIKRNNCVKKTIESIQKYCPQMKIYIADQNEPSGEMMQFYEAHNVEYYFVEPNSGLSKNRNFLVNKVKEEYIFIGDDDFTFTNKTKIKIMQEILDENKTIGIVGGELSETSNYCHRLIWDNKKKIVYMIQIDEEFLYTKKNHKFMYTDLVLNFFLAKKEVLKECKWDDDLKLAEHLEYFLRFKETKWKVAYTPNVFAIHDRERPDDYIEYRHQAKKYYKIMLKKYNMKDLSNIIQLKNSPLSFEKMVNIPSVEKTKEITIQCRIVSIETVFKEVYNTFINNNIKYCLLSETCKDAVLYGKSNLNTKDLYLGVDDLEKAKEILLNIDTQDVKVNLKKYNGATKLMGFFGTAHNVPFPVISYLKNTFGRNWNKKG